VVIELQPFLCRPGIGNKIHLLCLDLHTMRKYLPVLKKSLDIALGEDFQGLNQCWPLQAVHQIQVYHMDPAMPFKGLKNGLVWGKMSELEIKADLI